MTGVGFRMEGISFCPNCEFGDLDIPYWISVIIWLSDSFSSGRQFGQTVRDSDHVVFSEFVSGTERTLFRTNNGFSIINENEVIRR